MFQILCAIKDVWTSPSRLWWLRRDIHRFPDTTSFRQWSWSRLLLSTGWVEWLTCNKLNVAKVIECCFQGSVLKRLLFNMGVFFVLDDLTRRSQPPGFASSPLERSTCKEQKSAANSHTVSMSLKWVFQPSPAFLRLQSHLTTGCNLKRFPEQDPPRHAAPGFLTLRNCVCYRSDWVLESFVMLLPLAALFVETVLLRSMWV